MDRSDRFPRSRLGLVLRKAAEASAPADIDFDAVYARSGVLPAKAGRGRTLSRPLFITAIASVAPIAAALALVLGLGVFRPGEPAGPISHYLSPEHAAGVAAADLFVLEVEFDPSPEAVGEGRDLTAAVLDERSLEMDVGAFVADIWRETEL